MSSTVRVEPTGVATALTVTVTSLFAALENAVGRSALSQAVYACVLLIWSSWLVHRHQKRALARHASLGHQKAIRLAATHARAPTPRIAANLAAAANQPPRPVGTTVTTTAPPPLTSQPGPKSAAPARASSTKQPLPPPRPRGAPWDARSMAAAGVPEDAAEGVASLAREIGCAQGQKEQLCDPLPLLRFYNSREQVVADALKM